MNTTLKIGAVGGKLGDLLAATLGDKISVMIQFDTGDLTVFWTPDELRMLEAQISFDAIVEQIDHGKTLYEVADAMVVELKGIYEKAKETKKCKKKKRRRRI